VGRQVVLTYDVQQELNTVFFPEVLPVRHEEGGHVLDVTNLQMEFRPGPDPANHGLINYIDTKAKCRHLKNLPVKGLWVY
jgi:hypothetical protein